MTRVPDERDLQGIPRRELAIAVAGGAITGGTLFIATALLISGTVSGLVRLVRSDGDTPVT